MVSLTMTQRKKEKRVDTKTHVHARTHTHKRKQTNKQAEGIITCQKDHGFKVKIDSKADRQTDFRSHTRINTINYVSLVNLYCSL